MNIRNIFFAMTAWAFVSVACGNDSPGESPVQEWESWETIEGDVKVLVTTNNRIQDLLRTGVSYNTRDNLSPNCITLDPGTEYQTMDGFGAAVTGSTCYNLMQMSQEDRTRFLRETFSHETGLGYSYIRIAIGCSDFSLSEYTCCDEEGIENFALQSEEKEYVIPVLKEILAINPEIRIMGSPWTCPKWMKVDNLTDLNPFDSWTDGHLNPAYYDDYATYFVKWIQAFQNEGISIYSITPQNEPLNPGNSASLLMYWDEQQEFVRDALGPKMKSAGLSTKIYAFDHNYNYDDMDDQKNYPIKLFADEEAAQYFAGTAYHNYGGHRSELNKIHELRPDKELVFTETSIGTWNDGRNLNTRLIEDMREVALGTVNNWCRGVIVWNLMLDSERGPNRDGGCQTCYGAVDIDKADYRTMRRNSHYYIVGHLSAVVKPDAVRIGAGGYDVEGVTYAAFRNTDGSYAVVVLNESGDHQQITISDGQRHFVYEVPVSSVASFRWGK
ncbi:MAG: glucosylceramidase [Bacteroides sp.]|nr:glucosylceramidase [Bacteroides sp.]